MHMNGVFVHKNRSGPRISCWIFDFMRFVHTFYCCYRLLHPLHSAAFSFTFTDANRLVYLFCLLFILRFFNAVGSGVGSTKMLRCIHSILTLWTVRISISKLKFDNSIIRFCLCVLVFVFANFPIHCYRTVDLLHKYQIY